VRAGLLTALIRGVAEEFAPRAAGPELLLAEISRSLLPVMHQTGQPVFATAFCAVIDTAAGSLSYANAGHPPPMIRRGGSAAIDSLALPNPEPATGLMESFAYSRHTTLFLPGDTLLAYTDGFFEASNADGVMFGEKGLRSLLARQAGWSGAELIDHLISDVIAFTGRKEFEDDLCALAVNSTGQSCAVRPAATYDI
jgi:sigma-B regulation protein RsbU (phosphoserine phosphatase)